MSIPKETLTWALSGTRACEPGEFRSKCDLLCTRAIAIGKKKKKKKKRKEEIYFSNIITDISGDIRS